MIRDAGWNILNWSWYHRGLTLLAIMLLMIGHFTGKCINLMVESHKENHLNLVESMTDEERAQAKADHKYHGIIVSHVDEQGREFFYRKNGMGPKVKCWIRKHRNCRNVYGDGTELIQGVYDD